MKPGSTHYHWPPGDEVKRTSNYFCFITGEQIYPHDTAYWTDQFDSYVSERGYQMINNAYSTGEIEMNTEWQSIYGEWYAKDESAAGLAEMYHSEKMAKSHDDAGQLDN